MFSALIHLVGEIGSGGEGSPLSVTSPFSEIIRLVQIGIFTGILYLIKEMKKTYNSNDEAHSQVVSDIKELKSQVAQLTRSVSEITKNGPTA
jgi:hypothetical protein